MLTEVSPPRDRIRTRNGVPPLSKVTNLSSRLWGILFTTWSEPSLSLPRPYSVHGGPGKHEQSSVGISATPNFLLVRDDALNYHQIHKCSLVIPSPMLYCPGGTSVPLLCWFGPRPSDLTSSTTISRFILAVVHCRIHNQRTANLNDEQNKPKQISD